MDSNTFCTCAPPVLKGLTTEEKYSLCVNCLNAAEVIFVSLDTDGKIDFLNHHGCKVFGHTPETVVGRDWFQTFIPASRRKRARADFQECMLDSEPDRCEQHFTDTILAADGSKRTIVWSCSLWVDENGNNSGRICSGVDITLQEKFSETLRIHEKKMTFALHSAKLGIWELDIPSGKLELDTEWLRVLGYDPNEVQGDLDWFSSMIHPDDLETVYQERNDYLSGKTPAYQEEYRLKAKNGTWRTILSRGQVVAHDKNGLPKRMVGTHLDITSEKRSERILQDSRDRLQLALKGADLGMWDWFIPLDQVTYSERWATMLGYDPKELEPVSTTFFNLLHPDDRKRVKELLDLQFKETAPAFETEYRLKAKDGRWLWVLSRGLVIERTESGEPIRMTGTHLNITLRKESELELSRRIAVEQLLASITFSFVNIDPSSMDDAVGFSVKAIGRFLDAERGYVYLNEGGEKAILKGQWCASQEKCDLMTISDLDLNDFPWLRGKLTDYRPVHFDNTSAIPDEATEESRFFQKQNIRSFIAAPIIRDGKAVGFLGFDSLERDKNWTEEEVVLLESAANVVSQALESSRRAEDLHRTLKVKQALAELYPPLIDPSINIVQISEIIQKQAEQITASPHSFVGTIEEKTGDMICHTHRKMMERGCEVNYGLDLRFPCGPDRKFKALWGVCLNTGTSHVCNNLEESPHSSGLPEGHVPIQRYMGIPVLLDGVTVGIIGLANKPFDYDEMDVDAVQQMAAYMALALQGIRTRELALQSEAKFHQVVETMSDGMVISNEFGKITYVNKKFADMLGWEQEEILGRTMTSFLSERGQEETGETFRSRSELEDMSLDMALQTKDGKNVFCILSPATIRDEKGAFQGTFSVVHDITERRILESQLVQAQKLESIGQLAAGIAHEINTPTQYISNNTRFLEQSVEAITEIISGFIELVEKGRSGEPLDESLEKAARIIEETQPDFLLEELPEAVQESLQGLDRISNIVQSVKKFAHPGHEGMKLEDINAAILSTVTVSTNEWKYVATVETDLDPDIPPIPCLLGEFNQVLLNLIVNAAHAIQDVVAGTGTTGKITITSKMKNEYVEIRVSDSGTGIPPEIQSKIFDPFFTTKEVGRGTGQGLAISNRVIREKHNGRLSFETGPTGTTFIIELPASYDPEEESDEFEEEKP